MLIALFMVLPGCGQGESSITQAAADRVSQRLKDPSSAQFRNLTYHNINGFAHVVCGEVNAKNAMGGYAGFRPFIVVQKRSGSNQSDFDPKADMRVDVSDERNCQEVVARYSEREQVIREVMEHQKGRDPSSAEYKKTEESIKIVREAD